jgi:4-amino-4-deoxy-L-arabinose transferase-like glycosyltransferase
VTQPTPAIVPQSAVRRLPRVALWLFCAAYVLPGLFGREPWKGNEFTAFAHMLALAQGSSDWFNPTVFGQAPDLDALLPYWLGAWAIQWAPEWMSAGLASRLPFGFLLSITLASTWHSAYYLALSPQAQPVPFAFGGEAKPKDYARTIADGAVLGLIACLGLALLSHESSPILAQLAFLSLAFYGTAAISYHPKYSLSALTLGFIGLTLSGAPTYALLLSVGSGLICLFDRKSIADTDRYRHAIWLFGMSACIAISATVLNLWHWRLTPEINDWSFWRYRISLLSWFSWPVWPLAIWSIWTWRRQWTTWGWSRHLILPLWFSLLGIAIAFATKAPDRTLLITLPALATLGAFALPTLRRSMSALIDWFTLLFFSASMLIIWTIWIAMQTGWPAKTASNVIRLAPGFEASFGWLAFVFALCGTLSWAWLVHWRVRRHQHALWKSFVLPAGGTAVCWLLLMTLWLPLLDFARSYQTWVQQINTVMKKHDPNQIKCVMSIGISASQLSAFQYYGGLNMKPLQDARSERPSDCEWLIVSQENSPNVTNIVNTNRWIRIKNLPRPAEKSEHVTLYYRPSRQ